MQDFGESKLVRKRLVGYIVKSPRQVTRKTQVNCREVCGKSRVKPAPCFTKVALVGSAENPSLRKAVRLKLAANRQVFFQNSAILCFAPFFRRRNIVHHAVHGPTAALVVGVNFDSACE